jgi:hypothetical protein
MRADTRQHLHAHIGGAGRAGVFVAPLANDLPDLRIIKRRNRQRAKMLGDAVEP